MDDETILAPRLFGDGCQQIATVKCAQEGLTPVATAGDEVQIRKERIR